MNSGRRFQRHTIATYLRARGLPPGVSIIQTADAIVAHLDAQSITPERFRGFSYPATRHAIESALGAVTGGDRASDLTPDTDPE